MRVIKTKDPNSIKFLVDKIQELIDKEGITEYNKTLFLKWLRQNISFPILGLWIAIEEPETAESSGFNVLGFVIATIQSNLMEEFINISQLLGDEEVEKALLEKVYSWAKENGIHNIMTNSRYPERWKEDYGFEVEYHILMKDIFAEPKVVEADVVEVKEV